jgi:hypothetical protein
MFTTDSMHLSLRSVCQLCNLVANIFEISTGLYCSCIGSDDDRAIGVRSPAGAKDFSSVLCVQTGSGAHPASCTMGTGSPFPGAKRGRGMTLTTHPHLVPRSRMSRSYTSSPPKRHQIQSPKFLRGEEQSHAAANTIAKVLKKRRTTTYGYKYNRQSS